MKLPFKRQRTDAAAETAGAESAKSGKSTHQHRSTKPGRISLETAWWVVFLGTAVLLAALALLLHDRYASSGDELRRAQAEAVLDGFAGQIETAVAQYRGSLEYVANDAEVVGLVQGGAGDALRRKEATLAYLFPAAVRIRLLPAGFDTPDNTASPPISYACLDVIQRAERQDQAPPAEVHRAGSADQHIDLVQAIRGTGGRAVGTLLVSLPQGLLQQIVNRMRLNGGYVELGQGAGGNTLTVASRGSRPEGVGGPQHTVAVPGTAWQLAYWSAGTGAGAGQGLVYWASFGVVLVLLGIVMFLMHRAVLGALLQDQISILRLAKDLRDGAPATRVPARLKNSRGVLEQLQAMTREAPRRASGAGRAAAKPKPAAGTAPERPAPAPEAAAAVAPSAPPPELSGAIFRAYDIRGVVGQTLTADIVRAIGQAIGSEAHERAQQKVIVARDGRLSGPELSAALIQGLVASGREVIDIGRVPTPVLYFATHYLGSGSGVMLTGSHNPADYNGLKIMLAGQTLHSDDIQALRNRVETGKLITGEGSQQNVDVAPSYLDRITGDVRLARPMKVVVDCGNGVAGELAPALLRGLGCEVVELFCEVDGNFPNHHPDPGKPENLIALTRAVTDQSADLGIAFDGDGDRLGVVDSDGKIIWPDRLLMLLAQDVLLRQPGAAIIYDVKCTRHLKRMVREHGGEPIMAPTGHSLIKAKMMETGALLAGEMSGHIFYKERWFGFDDALYAAARLLEILASEPRPSANVFADLPESVSTPELNVATAEGEHFQLMQRLLASARFGGARLITIDGLRVEFEDGWGLVRASNTTPCLVLRFEAEDAEGLRRIQDEFRQQLLDLDPGLNLPF